MSDRLISGMKFSGFGRGDAAALFASHMPLADLPKSIKVAIDIGAHLGVVALQLAQRGLTVHCFEPSPRNFSWLLRNVEQNGYQKRVHCYNLGVADETGWMLLRAAGANTGMVSPLYRENRKACGQAFFIDINDCLDVVVGPIDYLKIDVEGMEHRFLAKISDQNWARIKLLDLEVHRVAGRWRKLYHDITVFPVKAYLSSKGFAPLPNTNGWVWRNLI